MSVPSSICVCSFVIQLDSSRSEKIFKLSLLTTFKSLFLNLTLKVYGVRAVIIMAGPIQIGFSLLHFSLFSRFVKVVDSIASSK